MDEYARVNLSSDPENAMNWASAIADADERREHLEHLAYTWRGFDPAAARSGNRQLRCVVSYEGSPSSNDRSTQAALLPRREQGSKTGR
jgi:hypothetical protein